MLSRHWPSPISEKKKRRGKTCLSTLVHNIIIPHFVDLRNASQIRSLPILCWCAGYYLFLHSICPVIFFANAPAVFFPPQVPEFMRFSVSFRVHLSLISFGAASNHLQISYQRIIPQRYHILILLLRHPIQSCNCTHNNPHEIRVIPLNSDHKILHIAGLLESTRATLTIQYKTRQCPRNRPFGI